MHYFQFLSDSPLPPILSSKNLMEIQDYFSTIRFNLYFETIQNRFIEFIDNSIDKRLFFQYMQAIKNLLTPISVVTQKMIRIYVSLENLDEKFELTDDIYQLSAREFIELFQKIQNDISSSPSLQIGTFK